MFFKQGNAFFPGTYRTLTLNSSKVYFSDGSDDSDDKDENYMDKQKTIVYLKGYYCIHFVILRSFFFQQSITYFKNVNNTYFRFAN